MKLSDWLDAHKVTDGDFAQRIGRSREAVRRYRKGERLPERDAMESIVRETASAVQPNDFFEIAA